MKKIMIIDDAEISNFIMKKMLMRVSNELEIHEYTLPAKAVDEIEQVNPDVIFLDLNMPVMNGWQFLDTMKKKNQHFTVYILSSSTNDLDLQKSKDYDNVKEFLIKPIDIKSLTNILHK